MLKLIGRDPTVNARGCCVLKAKFRNFRDPETIIAIQDDAINSCNQSLPGRDNPILRKERNGNLH